MRTLGVATTFMLTTLMGVASAAPAATDAPPATSSAAPAPQPSASAKPPPKKPTPVKPAAAAPAAGSATASPAAGPAPVKAAAPAAGAVAPSNAPQGAPTPPGGPAPAGQPPTSTPPPSGTAPTPDTSAPPIYYMEPQGPPAESSQIYEPEPPMQLYEPPPPPVPPRNGPPRTAFWAGARLGVMVPFGNLWVDGFGGYYRRRSFSDYASPGPVFELDVGARLARHYNVFALWEHASLGTGSLEDGSFGGQDRGATNLFGVGFRFSTDPARVGFLVEIGLGYRQFSAYWNDGTRLSLTDGWLDAHLGLGADIRMNRWLSLSPMIVLGGGSFNQARWSGPSEQGDALGPRDERGEYGTLSFVLGGHADVF